MIETWRFRHTPRIAGALLSASTWMARRRIKSEKPLRILVDSTILHHAVTHETGWISTGTSLWGGKHPIDTGYLARIPVHHPKTDRREYHDIKFLAGLINLSRTGHVKLFTSVELAAEQEYQPPRRFRAIGMFDFTLLQQHQLECVDGSPWTLVLSQFERGREAQSRRLDSKEDAMYHSLVKILGRKNSQDTWHLLTAEKYQLDFYLTMDYSFIENIKAQRKNKLVQSLATRVVTPAILGKELQIVPFPPLLLSYDNASYPVRPDLNLPNSKRGPSVRRPQ